MAARSQALHDALHTALAAGAQPVDRVEVLARVRAEGGQQPQEELAGTSLLLMPSRGEGFGLVGAEAIAAGVPVLVDADSGLGELLRTLARDLAPAFVVNRNGMVDEDQVIWAKRIVAVLTDVPRAYEAAAELRRTLAAQRTWESAAKEVLQAAGWCVPPPARVGR